MTATCQYCQLPSYPPQADPDHPCCRISIDRHFPPTQWCPCLLPKKAPKTRKGRP